MKGKFPNGLQEAMDAKGVGPTALAKMAGTSKQNISRWANESQKLTKPRAEKLAPFLDTTAAALLEVEELRVIRFPVVGDVQGGEDWFPVDQGGERDTVDIDLQRLDPIAIRVRGDSMMPVYRPGDSIIGSRRQGEAVENFIGRDCIVKTVAGEGMVKIVMAGSKPGLYRLRSYSTAYEDKTDVQLEWVAPVILTVRR